MRATRILLALCIVSAALTVIALGTFRGAMNPGPPRGERLLIPYVTGGGEAKTAHLVRARLTDARIKDAEDHLVVEVGPEVPADVIARVEHGTPALRVVRHERFTRTVGFWPRAWPFFAVGAVLLGVAGIVGAGKRRGGRAD